MNKRLFALALSLVAAGAGSQEKKKRDHWAFKAPVRPALPAVKRADQVRSPIDRFILARLEKEGLALSPEADRHALIRRLSLDLTGLPPDPEAVAAFVKDRDPRAYEKVVDRLLKSPHYGERWARVWLDLARYADTNGYEKDAGRTMWPWRDWVIRALNDDMPFDRFTVEQLAGDLLPDATPMQVLATAFHRNTMTNTEGGTSDEEFRVAAVLDRVDTTGLVWMGLTVGCAKCHEHKYDPIGNDEYYRLYAFLNQTEDADRGNNAPTMKVLPPGEAETAAREKKAAEAAWTPLRPTKMESAGGATMKLLDDGSVLVGGKKPRFDTYTLEFPTAGLGKIAALRLEALAHTSLPRGGPGRAGDKDGNFVLSRITASVGGNDVAFAKATATFEQKNYPVVHAIKGPDLKKNGWAIAPRQGQAHEAVFLAAKPVKAAGRLRVVLTHQFEYSLPGFSLGRFRLSASGSPDATVRKERSAGKRPSVPIMRELPEGKRRKTRILLKSNFLMPGKEVPPGVPAAFHPMPAGAPMNRLGLAKWLLDPRNPLTARGAVNRHWARFFGTGIVETEEDFGTQGGPPSHPALLDWLAVEFREAHGWSMKKLCKAIVMSATYRQSSRVTPALFERDGKNRLLARGPRFRLEAEMIRDQALAVSGLLSRKMYGPPVMPVQPAGVWQVVYNGSKWVTSKGGDKHRRGLYTYLRRTSPYPSFLTFDGGSGEVCMVRRIRTNTPLGALVTMNDPVYVEAAQAFGRRIAAEGGKTVDKRAAWAFLTATARPPRPEEMRRIVRLYRDQLAIYRKQPEAAKKLGADASGAAWTVVANVLLNLDEVLTKG